MNPHSFILQMVSVLVTGANRGVGLGLVKELLKQEKVSVVFATTRGTKDKELREIKDAKLQVLEMDVGDDRSIAVAAGKVRERVGDAGLDVLVNNAGIYVQYKVEGPVQRRELVQQLEINSAAPLIVAQSFLELLRAAAKTKGSSKLATISSMWGSIETNGGSYGERHAIAYNMSKAAVNMMTHTLAVDWKDDKIIVASFCPGWVQTDMGGKGAAITAEESAEALVESIVNKLGNEHSGQFFHRDMKRIPY